VARTAKQLELELSTWGGRRANAGRKPAPGRRRMSHAKRARHDPRCPAHVTLRAAGGLSSLRANRVFPAVRAALIVATSSRFRVLQFSVQRDHLHLLVEASTPTGFERGVRGLAIRVARAVNRVLCRRGSVWGDRYHARLLKTPREVRNALVYVLSNWRRHEPRARGLDPRSSAAWFEGWRRPAHGESGLSPVAAPRTCLAAVGWKLRGLIGVDERPRGAP
jgi:REP-associated tyrosine transposase